ncbi:transposase family protein [Amycolatopsis albispora]|uniref:Transposase n=1 Tax=Amycolatopsis albispora TaxID=1804986 RepID=A0A344LBV3_9PSEU|nr:transposase family protein [Amycolatopsis albispora]AXB45527.1 transposase [Amycolatopsis albispora]
MPHPATRDVSRALTWYVARLLAAHRHTLGTRRNSRALTCYRQATLGLYWFRHTRTDITALGHKHGVSRATAYRYIDEVITVLATQAPGIHDALDHARARNLPYLMLDGKVFPTDRLAEKTLSVKGEPIDLWYAGKARAFGGNIQLLTDPAGFPLWVSDVEPGSVHDMTIASDQALPALYTAAAHGMPTLADSGYDRAGIGVHTPIKHPSKNHHLDPDNRTRNALLRGLRAQAERGFALLTGRWRTLHHTTKSPRALGAIVQAALALTHYEHSKNI